ncbi:unnamed protein product [Cylicostephanus goldi]|uniref:Reverse transcriptase domain-containing protein n=1 Tax=Cylicostephanus goldi TaxID=71465 RepID=A0A3P6RXF3_CYLGO|nr:unnamed protein product [Cylicostephanus goldi]
MDSQKDLLDGSHMDSTRVEKIDRKVLVTVCYMDYTKSFDSASSNLLFAVFLLNTQQILINKSFSSSYQTSSGVPQGTCLEHSYFPLCINDLPLRLPNNIFCSIYADDTKFSCYNAPKLMQKTLNAVKDCSAKWELDISVENIRVMFDGAKHPRFHDFYLKTTKFACETSLKISVSPILITTTSTII